MTKDIITSVIILLLLIVFALWSIARNIKESIVDVTFAIEKLSAEIRRVRESIDGLREETAKLRIQAMKDKPDDHKVEEIVRCEDCKHWNFQDICGVISNEKAVLRTGFDFYCGYGERKVKNDGQTDFTASGD